MEKQRLIVPNRQVTSLEEAIKIVSHFINNFINKEISDEEIEKAKENAWSDYEYQEGNLYSTTFSDGWKMAIKWYREQLKQRQ
jgi:hypothetical protein